MFHVGQLVVCVDDDFPTSRAFGFDAPKKGEICTIRSIDPNGEMSFTFEEIRNPPFDFDEGFTEVEFLADHFRPIAKTSISIFTAMLSPTKADA
jgi:hypothetical protein